ncbi:MAG: DUF5312 domain-containing protein [Treponemataceae bacterium]|nr:DUF5312 domain-containing protein [Treponemataceae bacterium]
MKSQSSFDSLVISLDNEERRSLLERIRSSASSADDPMDIRPSSQNEDTAVDLSVKINSESILLRIWLYIKAAFTGTSRQNLYNDLLIKRKSRYIGRNYPELYDSVHNVLRNSFYESIRNLRIAADFFKQPISAYEDNPGASFVTIGSFLIPDIYESIDAEASPYSIPFNREVTNELKLSLFRKLEDCLQTMPQEKRNRMYFAVRNLEWLRQFINLPFEKLLAHFNSVDQSGYSCPVDAVSSELAQFSKVFSFVNPFSPEVIGSLFLLARNGNNENNNSSEEFSIDSFREKCDVQLGMIKSFTQSIPLFALTAISFNSASWVAEKPAGVENWFSKFKTEWRKIFDKQWESWLLDRKKELLKQKFITYFDVSDVPLFPVRPWTSVWTGVPCAKEYTLGFLYLFFGTLYPQMISTFRTIVIDGDFVLKENSIAFTDACNEFTTEELSLSSLKTKLSPNGEWAVAIANISGGNIQTIQSQTRIDALMLSVETEVGVLASKFGQNCKMVLRLLDGILRLNQQYKDVFDTLTNLSRIKGKENAQFMKELSKSRDMIEYTIEILKDVEEIDNTVMVSAR